MGTLPAMNDGQHADLSLNAGKWIYFDSSLKLSDLVNDLETTDKAATSAIAVARRIDAAIVVEEQEGRVVTVRRSRPIIAAAPDIEQTAAVVVAITRSRIPDILI